MLPVPVLGFWFTESFCSVGVFQCLSRLSALRVPHLGWMFANASIVCLVLRVPQVDSGFRQCLLHSRVLRVPLANVIKFAMPSWERVPRLKIANQFWEISCFSKITFMQSALQGSKRLCFTYEFSRVKLTSSNSGLVLLWRDRGFITTSLLALHILINCHLV